MSPDQVMVGSALTMPSYPESPPASTVNRLGGTGEDAESAEELLKLPNGSSEEEEEAATMKNDEERADEAIDDGSDILADEELPTVHNNDSSLNHSNPSTNSSVNNNIHSDMINTSSKKNSNNGNILQRLRRAVGSIAPQDKGRESKDQQQAPKAERVGPIRVGFVSRYLHRHPVGYLTQGLIANLPRPGFRVLVFRVESSSSSSSSDGSNEDDFVARHIDSVADDLFTLPASLNAAAHLIRQQRLDVLVYPELGMDPVCYFLAFARLAPSQVVWWGHPDTSGIASVDYFVTSEVEIPTADAFYSERLVRFKGLGAYFYKPAFAPLDRKDAFAPNSTDDDGYYAYNHGNRSTTSSKSDSNIDDVGSADVNKGETGNDIIDVTSSDKEKSGEETVAMVAGSRGRNNREKRRRAMQGISLQADKSGEGGNGAGVFEEAGKEEEYQAAKGDDDEDEEDEEDAQAHAAYLKARDHARSQLQAKLNAPPGFRFYLCPQVSTRIKEI